MLHAITQPTTIQPDPLAIWRKNVTIAPVSPIEHRHAIHAYFTTTPEQPGGRHVLFYASTTPEAHIGNLCLLDRATGAERTLARDVTTEDAHRAACQQWLSNGRRVVFHDLRDGEWVVVSVDVDTLTEHILARGRQLGWVQPHADLVLLYGPHWDPDAFRDLELLDLATGACRTVLTAAAVRTAFPQPIEAEFGDRPISVFHPVLSPDLTRVFFKLATPLGGDFRSTQASHRALLVCYDLAHDRFLFLDQQWGHPAWHPDSGTILNVPNVLIDSNTGVRRQLTDLPVLPGSHPSFSPDGAFCVSDVALERKGGTPGEWGIVVEHLATQQSHLIYRFDDSQGATSWRRCHPHPVFSPDGQRIYFCVSTTSWSRLHVATSGA